MRRMHEEINSISTNRKCIKRFMKTPKQPENLAPWTPESKMTRNMWKFLKLFAQNRREYDTWIQLPVNL